MKVELIKVRPIIKETPMMKEWKEIVAFIEEPPVREDTTKN
jgi:hypothetical protein